MTRVTFAFIKGKHEAHEKNICGDSDSETYYMHAGRSAIIIHVYIVSRSLVRKHLLLGVAILLCLVNGKFVRSRKNLMSFYSHRK